MSEQFLHVITRASRMASLAMMHAHILSDHYGRSDGWHKNGIFDNPVSEFGEFLKFIAKAERAINPAVPYVINAKRDSQLVWIRETPAATAHQAALKYVRQVGSAITRHIWSESLDGTEGTSRYTWDATSGLTAGHHAEMTERQWEAIKTDLRELQISQADYLAVKELISLESTFASSAIVPLTAPSKVQQDRFSPIHREMLARFIDDALKGNSQRGMILIMESNGRISLEQLAYKLEWEEPFDNAWSGFRKRICEKWSELPYVGNVSFDLRRIDNHAVLKISDRPASDKKQGRSHEVRKSSTGRKKTQNR